LENIPLSESEYENIFCFGKVMLYLASDSNNPHQCWAANADDMAVIADVHTDSNTRLTDEQWREMLIGGAPPVMPDWTAHFMDMAAPQPAYHQYSPLYLYHGEFTGVDTEEILPLPETVRLLQNYPNPFNAETTIGFDVPRDVHVTVVMYNVLGQRIRILFDEPTVAGTHTVRWDGTDSVGREVPSGVYLCRMEAGELGRTEKMVLLR